MNASAHQNTDVLIVGAGPTGLVLALWLTHFGVSVRIVDQTAEPGTTSRALAVQARTLELCSQLGLADTGVGQEGRPNSHRRDRQRPQSVSLRRHLPARRT